MHLYIANCTQQAQDFVYRLPGAPNTRTQRIEIGQQMKISGDLERSVIDAIIEQHVPYGLKPADEVDRTRTFVGMCYSVDKPVSMERVRIALVSNNRALIERGREIRQQAAVAVNNAMEQEAPGLTALEMSVVEEPSKSSGKDPELAEGVRVTRREQPGPVRGRNKRRG